MAFYRWEESTQGEISCDNKDPFAPIRLSAEKYSHFEDWLGLGIESELDPTESLKAQEQGIANMIQQHEQLCDLLHERALGL